MSDTKATGWTFSQVPIWLLCGHDINRLRESDWCAECEGTGKIPTDEGRELIEFMRWYERAG